MRLYVLIMALDRWPVRSLIQDSLLPLDNETVTNVPRKSYTRIRLRWALDSNSSGRSFSSPMARRCARSSSAAPNFV